MDTSTPLITLSHVNQGFSIGDDDVKILHDVNISIPEGSFSIVYGSSGSGKSTLLNVITGLQEPLDGQVSFLGNDLFSQTVDERSATRAQTLGMVYQANYWIKSLSVLENVAIPLYFLGYKKSDADKKALISLDRIGIAQHAHKHPAMLSGGEQQRVSMARALVNDPPIIIADEPTGNLDSQNSDVIISLLKGYQKESGRTVILVTHELEFLPLGTHLFRIQDGVVTTVQGDDVQTSAHKLIESMKTRIDKLANIYEN